MRVFWFAGLLFLARWAHGSEYWNATELEAAYYGAGGGSPPLLVGLTLIQSAAAKGAGNTHLLSAFLLLFLTLSDLCTLFGFPWLSSHLIAGNQCDAICGIVYGMITHLSPSSLFVVCLIGLTVHVESLKKPFWLSAFLCNSFHFLL